MRNALSERIESGLAAMPVVALNWFPAIRVVPRFPPIEQLEQFDVELQAAVLAEVASVDPKVIGDLRLLPAGALPAGPGASRIITSYTFARPGRFNDASFAAFYGGESLSTAIAETVHHILPPLRASNAPDQTLPLRSVLHVDVRAVRVVDARSVAYPEIYDAGSYVESQRFGAMVHQRDYDGIVYRSVRRRGGQCVAVYAPAVLGGCREHSQLIYRYTRGQIEVSELHYTSGDI